MLARTQAILKQFNSMSIPPENLVVVTPPLNVIARSLL